MRVSLSETKNGDPMGRAQGGRVEDGRDGGMWEVSLSGTWSEPGTLKDKNIT